MIAALASGQHWWCFSCVNDDARAAVADVAVVVDGCGGCCSDSAYVGKAEWMRSVERAADTAAHARRTLQEPLAPTPPLMPLLPPTADVGGRCESWDERR